MRWNLTWLANDIMLWVRAFSRMAVGNLHNNSGIRCLRALWALEVRNGYRCKLSWLLVWISYSSWLYPTWSWVTSKWNWQIPRPLLIVKTVVELVNFTCRFFVCQFQRKVGPIHCEYSGVTYDLLLSNIGGTYDLADQLPSNHEFGHFWSWVSPKCLGSSE